MRSGPSRFATDGTCHPLNHVFSVPRAGLAAGDQEVDGLVVAMREASARLLD